MAQFRDGVAQAQVVRPKVVSPVANAVRLVHHKQVDRLLLQKYPELGVGELFGRSVDKILLTFSDGCFQVLPLAQREMAIDSGYRDAALPEGVGLVLHEGDKRANDDRGAF